MDKRFIAICALLVATSLNADITNSLPTNQPANNPVAFGRGGGGGMGGGFDSREGGGFQGGPGAGDIQHPAAWGAAAGYNRGMDQDEGYAQPTQPYYYQQQTPTNPYQAPVNPYQAPTQQNPYGQEQAPSYNPV